MAAEATREESEAATPLDPEIQVLESAPFHSILQMRNNALITFYTITSFLLSYYYYYINTPKYIFFKM